MGVARKEAAAEKRKQEAGKRTNGKPTKPAATAGRYSPLQLAGAAGALLVALLIAGVHLLKRARRKAARERRRRIAAGEDPDLVAAPPSWIVSEERLALALGGLVALVLVGSVAVVLIQRLLARWRAKLSAASEKGARATASAMRAAALVRAKEAYAAAKSQARGKDEASRREQRAFEEKLLCEIRAQEKETAEAAAAEAAAAREEAAAARREAARIDELTRAGGFGGGGRPRQGGGGGLEEDDDWDVGCFDFDAEEKKGEEGEEEEQNGSEEGGADGTAVADKEDEDEDDPVPPPADRLQLELNPAVRGSRLTLSSLHMPPTATARPASLSLVLSCAKCSHGVTLGLGGLTAAEAERKTWCEKCGALLGAALRPCLLHATSSVYRRRALFDWAVRRGAYGGGLLSHRYGYVDATHASVLDVPRLSVLMSCGRCDAELVLPDLQRGRTVQAGCRECHAPLSLGMSNVTVERVGEFSVTGVGRVGGSKGGADDDDEMEGLLRKLRRKNLDQLKVRRRALSRRRLGESWTSDGGHLFR